MSKELKDLPVIVLASGFGTRLSSVLPDVPVTHADTEGLAKKKSAFNPQRPFARELKVCGMVRFVSLMFDFFVR